MKYEDPLIDETVHGNDNVSDEAPLKTFFKLLAALATLIIIGYFLLAAFIFQVVKYIPLETEKRWFESFSSAMIDNFASQDSTSLTKSAELQRIADQLIEKTLDNNPNSAVKDIEVVLHFGDDDMVNAFALPGGHIVVMRGLIEAMPNENALAMVIGHEIAHVAHRDVLKSLGRGVLTSIVFISLFGGDGMGMLDSGLSVLSNGYSRSYESSADQLGLQMLHHTYDTAFGATTLFALFAAEEGRLSRWAEFANTHPISQRRIDAIQATIKRQRLSVNSNITPLPSILKTD